MTQTLKPLSRRQRDLLNIITATLDEYGRAPTIREIADIMGVASTNGVNDHINALVRKGYIELDSGVARGVRPLRYADSRSFKTRKELLQEVERLQSQLRDMEQPGQRAAQGLN